MNIQETVSDYLEHKKISSTEGSRGVQNLCKLVRGLGYRDSMHRMQYGDACLGDLVEFLEDNPGCIEAIFEWVGEHGCDDWKEVLESELPAKEGEYGNCQDCENELGEDGYCKCKDCWYCENPQNTAP